MRYEYRKFKIEKGRLCVIPTLGSLVFLGVAFAGCSRRHGLTFRCRAWLPSRHQWNSTRLE